MRHQDLRLGFLCIYRRGIDVNVGGDISLRIDVCGLEFRDGCIDSDKASLAETLITRVESWDKAQSVETLRQK